MTIEGRRNRWGRECCGVVVLVCEVSEGVGYDSVLSVFVWLRSGSGVPPAACGSFTCPSCSWRDGCVLPRPYAVPCPGSSILLKLPSLLLSFEVRISRVLS